MNLDVSVDVPGLAAGYSEIQLLSSLSVHVLLSGQPPSSDVPAGSYPFMVRSDDGRQVPVVQAYAFGKYLGYLKVTFDDAGDVLRSTGNPILLDADVSQGNDSTETVTSSSDS